jgi:hypothetical protein
MRNLLSARAPTQAVSPNALRRPSKTDSRKHAAIFCTRASTCDRSHVSPMASNSSVPCSTGRCCRSQTYCTSITRSRDGSSLIRPSASLGLARKAAARTANRTASQGRACGIRWQESAYPKLQPCKSSASKRSPSCPGAVQYPLHARPSGSRAGCGHAPFSNFSIGIKNGHAMPGLSTFSN